MIDSTLPSNSTDYEIAITDALDTRPTFLGAISGISHFKTARPIPDGFGAFLVWEEGLSPISKFFATHAETLDSGKPWRELRETPAGVLAALSWIGYSSSSLEDQNAGRLKWNRYQIAMGQLPPLNEVETLNDAEYLADLSDGARDVPFRGFYGYDVRALIAGVGKAGQNLIASDSGVRVEDGNTLWSHGEEFSVSSSGAEQDRILLGVNYAQGQTLTWEDIPWDTPGVTWEGVQDVAAFKSWAIMRKEAYIAFWDASGDLIGARRVGEWKDELASVSSSSVLKFTARTDFGNGSGKTASSCGLVFHASNINAEKPGKQWLEPNEIAINDGLTIDSAVIAQTPISINFKETVRVLVEFTLTI